jgi:hypothetical protein
MVAARGGGWESARSGVVGICAVSAREEEDDFAGRVFSRRFVCEARE